MSRVVVHVHLNLANGLPLACLPSSGLLRLTWLQLDTHIVDFWLQVGLIRCPDGARGLHRALPRVCVQWYQVSKWDLQPTPIAMTQYLLLDVYTTRADAMVAIGQVVVYEFPPHAPPMVHGRRVGHCGQDGLS